MAVIRPSLAYVTALRQEWSRSMKCLILSRTLLFALIVATSSQTSWAQGGAALYRQRCAVCHEGGASDRAPDRAILQYMPAASIARTLETGVMREMAGSLSPAQRDAIAAFLTGGAPRAKADAAPHPPVGPCPALAKSFSLEPSAPHWSGWSPDLANPPFQSTAIAGIPPPECTRCKHQ